MANLLGRKSGLGRTVARVVLIGILDLIGSCLPSTKGGTFGLTLCFRFFLSISIFSTGVGFSPCSRRGRKPYLVCLMGCGRIDGKGFCSTVVRLIDRYGPVLGALIPTRGRFNLDSRSRSSVVGNGVRDSRGRLGSF